MDNINFLRNYLIAFAVVSSIGQLFFREEMWSLAGGLASYL